MARPPIGALRETLLCRGGNSDTASTVLSQAFRMPQSNAAHLGVVQRYRSVEQSIELDAGRAAAFVRQVVLMVPPIGPAPKVMDVVESRVGGTSRRA